MVVKSETNISNEVSKKKEDHFLFVHFIGEQEDGEQIYFSVSQDGKHFKDLNQGKPVLRSTVGEKGVRDPFLIRDPKRGIFYLIATDLCIHSGKGWQAAQDAGSLHIVVWESLDLIYWSKARLIPIDLPEATNVWAPEAIYDSHMERFLLFWSSKTNGKHKIYGAYTSDFVHLDKPFLFLERPNDVIDSTIISNESNFYRFSKDETTSRIIMEHASALTGDYTLISSPKLIDFEGVEGPEIYQVSPSKWYLIIDQFMTNKGYTILASNDLDSGEFVPLTEEEYHFGMNLKRHGGILPINQEEYQRLLSYYDQKNPVIPGLWADPYLVKFGDEYYIYPTTDGFSDWGSDKFSVFRSTDLQHFEHAAVIIDFATDQVPWAVSNAWAPCITEKDDTYYYYFCGKRSDGQSCIGVAWSQCPTGPFIADASPLLDPEMIAIAGFDIAQVIDPSIYQENNQYYILFGNGHTGAIAELSEDMRSIRIGTLHQYEGLTDFREAVEVLKKDGLYHFTWSCDDTGSENYHVNYGIAKDLYGPVLYQYPILTKVPNKAIFGTGHHSIFKEPNDETYYIAYHRFATPLERYAEGTKGFSRETCISPIDFDSNGLMRPVIL